MKNLTKHLDLFAYLNKKGVEYILVGGLTAIAYGVPRTTVDIDILINPTIPNAERLLAVLKKLNMGTASLITPEELIKEEVTIFKDYIRLDVLTRLKSFQFSDVYPHRNMVQIGKLMIPILSLEDLLKEKKSVARNKDEIDIEVLTKIASSKKRK